MFEFFTSASAFLNAAAKAIKAALMASALCSALPLALQDVSPRAGISMHETWYDDCMSIATRAGFRGVPPDLAIATAFYESRMRNGIVSSRGGLFGAMQVTGANISRVDRPDYDYEDVGIEVLRRYLARYDNVYTATCSYRFGSPAAKPCRGSYVSPRPALAAAVTRRAEVQSDIRHGIYLTPDVWHPRTGQPQRGLLEQMRGSW